MSNDQQQGDQKVSPSANDYLGMTYFVCDVYRTIPGPFLRYGQGVEAYGVRGGLAFVGLLTCCTLARDWVLWLFMALWIVALVYRRVQTLLLIRRGAIIHSRYAGDPWLAFKVPFVRSEHTAMGIIEPSIMMLAGVMTCPLSINLGALLMVGWLALMVHHGIEREIDRKRLERMRDAAIEAQWYGDRFRRGG